LGGGLEAQERTKKTKRRDKRKVNPSTPRHKFWGLPFDKLKALRATEGLRVDPERRFLTPPLKAGLAFDPSSGREGAAEWVNFFIMITLLCKKTSRNIWSISIGLLG
jgi:hypothetical protein